MSTEFTERDVHIDCPFWFFSWTDCHCGECDDECRLDWADAEITASVAFDAYWADAEGEARHSLRGTGLEGVDVFCGVSWTLGRPSTRWGEDATHVFTDRTLSEVLGDLVSEARGGECLGLYFDGDVLSACGEWTECAVLLTRTQYDVLMHWALGADWPELSRWAVNGSPLLDAVLELSELEGRAVLAFLSDLDGDADADEISDDERLAVLSAAIAGVRVVSDLGGVFADAVLSVLAD
jgi:hypothetical protein